jgi:hypothetical protein
MNIFWKPFIVCKFPDLSDEDDWKKYELKKDKFISLIAEQKESEEGSVSKNGILGNKYYNQSNILIEEMLNPSIPRFKEKGGYTMGEIATLLGTKQPAISMRLKKYKEYQEQLMARKMMKEKMLSGEENGN